MDYIQSLLENSNIPIITAFLLGILTAISPCPLATNVTAIAYISKDIESKHRIFLNGLLYTLGRLITYTVLGFILIPILRQSASIYAVQKIIGKYGQMIIAPALILIGIFMLEIIKIKLPQINARGNNVKAQSGWGALLLGILFSLAFCPSSGVLYFGMLMPMSAAESGGYLLPIVYAIATGLPVIIVAWILAYSVVRLGKFYNQMQLFEKWMRKIVALLFIAVGIYYLIIYYL